jgi:putative flippase GtrA
MRRRRLPEFGRFLSVGVLNLLFGLLVIYGAKWFLQFGDVAANALGYAAGLALSFTLNSRWTFAYRGARAPAAFKFVLVALLAYALNLLTVLLAIRVGVNDYLAQALGIPPYTLASYLLSKHLVFRTQAPDLTDRA